MAFSELRNAPKNTHFSRLLSGKKVSNNIVPLSCRGVNLDSLAHGVLRLSNGVRPLECERIRARGGVPHRLVTNCRRPPHATPRGGDVAGR